MKPVIDYLLTGIGIVGQQKQAVKGVVAFRKSLDKAAAFLLLLAHETREAHGPIPTPKMSKLRSSAENGKN